MTRCDSCKGTGLVGDYGPLGLDFNGPKECPDCRGGGKMKRVIIFDIDGTLANIEHRLHHIQQKPKNWNAFKEGILLDEPIEQTILIAHSIAAFNRDAFHMIALTGRNESMRADTLKWLQGHSVMFDEIFMRPDGDNRPDFEFKSEAYEAIKRDFGEVYMVFEDRKRVIDMWLSKGVYVLDVSQGQDY